MTQLCISFQEDAEAAKVKEERLAAYAAKKAKSMRIAFSVCLVLFSLLQFVF